VKLIDQQESDMPKIRLTPQFIKSVVCQQGTRKTLFFDADCKWLVLEVRATGTATYYLRYQDSRSKTRLLKVGDERDLSLAQARQIADKYRAMIAMGQDPALDKAQLRQVPTVYDFIHNSYLPFIEGYKRSWKCDQGLLRKHIEPIWGKRYLDQISKADVIALMAKHRTTHAPGSCNRLLILLRYVFSCSLKWETPGIKANPTAGISLMKEDNVKERYLSTEEAQRLYEVLTRSDNAMLQYIIPMLILTGARKREVLDARWEDFDYERRLWRIHTTKHGKPRFVPLSDGVINLLESVPHHDCEWAFPNPKTLKPYVSIYYSWDSARCEARLEDVRVHDLRHSYASFLVNAGRSLYEVQRLLGHTQIKTTQRYAHLSHDTLLDASNAVTRAVGEIFMPAPSSPQGARLLSVAV
jgi:integrase